MDGIFTGWKRMRSDSSILENDGVHMLDLMRFFSEVKPIDFEIIGDKLLGGSVPETIHLRLDYPKKVKGYLRLGIMFGGKQTDPYLAGSLTKKQLTLIGDKGSIELDFNENTMEVTDVEYKETTGGFTPFVNGVRARKCPNITPLTLLEQCFKHFLRTIEDRAPVLCGLKEGAVEITELLELARERLAN
jgi:predicted dehydrogenase